MSKWTPIGSELAGFKILDGYSNVLFESLSADAKDAHLAAAAPEMLAMLKRCEEALGSLGHAQSEVVALIAKAEGGS